MKPSGQKKSNQVYKNMVNVDRRADTRAFVRVEHFTSDLEAAELLLLDVAAVLLKVPDADAPLELLLALLPVSPFGQEVTVAVL